MYWKGRTRETITGLIMVMIVMIVMMVMIVMKRLTRVMDKKMMMMMYNYIYFSSCEQIKIYLVALMNFLLSKIYIKAGHEYVVFIPKLKIEFMILVTYRRSIGRRHTSRNYFRAGPGQHCHVWPGI